MEDIQDDVLTVDEEDNICTQGKLSESMEEEKSAITIKDSYLSTKVALSMTLVDCVHHAAVVAAIGSALCSQGVHESLVPFGKPLAACSAIANIGYFALWKRCPLSKYRISTRPTLYRMLTRQPQLNTVIVLRETGPQYRAVHVVTSLAALALAFWPDVYRLGEKLFHGSGEDTASDAAEASSSIVDKVKETFERKEVDNIQI